MIKPARGITLCLMRLFVASAWLCLWPAFALAQTSTPAVPTDVQVLILPSTGDPVTIAPVATASTPLSSVACNLAAPPAVTTPLVNPASVYYDDPAVAGRACRVPMPVGLPAGSYRAVAVFVAPSCNPTGTQEIKPCPSVRSAVAVPPFSIVNLIPAPGAPTGARVTP